MYGLAAYDTAIASFYAGAFQDAAEQFHRLLQPKTGLAGYDPRRCGLWYRHAAACAAYHAQHARLGIPEPVRLDPLCGIASLSSCLQAVHLPWSKQVVMQSCRVTGEGSTIQDLLN